MKIGQVVMVGICLVPPGLVAYADLDERAIDALREFNEEGALSVLLQFKESDLSHVQVSYRGRGMKENEYKSVWMMPH